MGLPPPPKGFQEDPLCYVKGLEPLRHEGQVASQHGETMHATFFTNWKKLWNYLCQPHLMFSMSTLEI